MQLQPVATGLNQPMFVTAPANDARQFYVERNGVIRVQQSPGSTPTTFLDISSKVDTDGERGMLGLAFDPDYAANGRFYVNYRLGRSSALHRAVDAAVVAEPLGQPVPLDAAAHLVDDPVQRLARWPVRGRPVAAGGSSSSRTTG